MQALLPSIKNNPQIINFLWEKKKKNGEVYVDYGHRKKDQSVVVLRGVGLKKPVSFRHII